MSHDDLTSAERAEIERVHGVLADRAVWAEPSPDLQERVVAAIAEEHVRVIAPDVGGSSWTQTTSRRFG